MYVTGRQQHLYGVGCVSNARDDDAVRRSGTPSGLPTSARQQQRTEYADT